VRKKLQMDIFLTVSILALAALLFLFFGRSRDPGSYVTVEADGVLLGNYVLSEDTQAEFRFEDGTYNILEIRDGRASVSEADCRDQICVHHSPVSKAGETIICLPHKFVVTVSGGGE